MRGAAAASAVHPRCPPAGFPPSPRPPIPLFRRAPKVTDRRGEGGTPRRGAAAVKVGSPMGSANACVPLGSLAIWAHPRQPSSSAGTGAPVTQLRPATVSGSLSLRFAALSRCCSSTCQAVGASWPRRGVECRSLPPSARHRPVGQPPGGCPPWPLSPCSSWGTRQRYPAWSIGLLHRPFRIHPGQG